MTWLRHRIGPRLTGRLRRTIAPLLAGLLFAALRDAADGLALAAGSLLAPLAPAASADLPDPGQPSTVGIGLALGGLAGGVRSRACGGSRTSTSRA